MRLAPDLAHPGARWYARGMLVRIGLLALATAASPSGCDKIFGDGSQNAHAPGTDLGSFHVTATSTSNTCGAGALGAQSSWQFDVRLQRDTGVLYWNNGQAAIAGALSDDGVTFSFDTQVIQNMRDPSVVGPPPCSVTRADHASGKLDSAGDTVASFSGELSYTFSPTAGSNCEDLVFSETPVVAALPCSFGYAMTGSSAAVE